VAVVTIPLIEQTYGRLGEDAWAAAEAKTINEAV